MCSLLIHVVFDNNTHFYIRTIYNSGKNYEDKDADFEDLKKQISVEIKGRFDNDVFHASEIRLSNSPDKLHQYLLAPCKAKRTIPLL